MADISKITAHCGPMDELRAGSASMAPAKWTRTQTGLGRNNPRGATPENKMEDGFDQARKVIGGDQTKEY